MIKKMRKIMIKGFTLIELLAVIVILAIIALIAMPLILNVIDDAKKGAFKNAAYGIIETSEFFYANKLLNGGTREVTFTYVNGVKTSSVNGMSSNYKGTKPKSGIVVINGEGKIGLAIYNGKYCAEKTFEESKVTISEKK